MNRNTNRQTQKIWPQSFDPWEKTDNFPKKVTITSISPVGLIKLNDIPWNDQPI